MNIKKILAGDWPVRAEAMKARLLGPILTGILAACAPTVSPIKQGSEGYDAIEFTRVTQIQDHAFNIYTFAAGRRFIADRYGKDGRKLYCGLLTLNNDVKPYDTCIGFEAPNVIILGPGEGFKEVRRPQNPRSIRALKARF
ncbi:hypothetical protein ASC75_02445 [Aminobacter sp. DSM 101952]|uniref:hypothetical protein n=1 Tax=Aminobacter sp. DSM 101952 TaxID=2735891 RepID=UPI0006FCA69B|nr:hypothetical protein [Aminobacter sp. DSM 101952]KQU76494.1 hypothetical protein ASC75_02445 [Aminobacter sp. DSM 101952]